MLRVTASVTVCCWEGNTRKTAIQGLEAGVYLKHLGQLSHGGHGRARNGPSYHNLPPSRIYTLMMKTPFLFYRNLRIHPLVPW